jgi:hypothetical protein
VWWLTHETNAQAMLLYDRIADKSGFVQAITGWLSSPGWRRGWAVRAKDSEDVSTYSSHTLGVGHAKGSRVHHEAGAGVARSIHG